MTSGLLCLAASASVDAAPRAEFFSPGLAPRAPEVMVYFSHSIGAGANAAMRPTFGLRVRQVRQGVNTGDPESGDAMQHRDLVNWQMEAHSNLHIADLRVKLGNRLTYDVTNRRFGSPSNRSAMDLGLPSLRNAPIGPPQTKPLFAHSSGPAATAHETVRDNSSIREIASAAIAALTPSRFNSELRQPVQRPGGIGAIVAAQRMQSARAGFANPN